MRILVEEPAGWPVHRYGEMLRVWGKLSWLPERSSESYENYLRSQRINGVIRFASVEKLEGRWGNPIRRTLADLRTTFETRVLQIFPEPSASLLMGLLTGNDNGLPEHMTQAFRATGLSHITAVSGSNITLVAAFVSGTFLFLPRRWRILPTAFLLAAYALLTGGSASVVRATIMGILGLIILESDRPKNGRLLILWTAVLMVLWNPRQLWWDAGFQLSFLSVIGLQELKPILEPHLARLPHRWKVREVLLVTISAQLATVPWASFLFGTFSLVAPLSNLLVALPVSAAMFLGFLGTIASWLVFPLGQVTGYVAWLPLTFILAVAETFANIPLASVDTGKIGIGLVLIYYISLIAVIWRCHGERVMVSSVEPRTMTSRVVLRQSSG